MVLDGKCLQEYPVNAGVLPGSILGLTLFLLYINDLLDDVICNIICADGTTFYCKFDQASDLWQQHFLSLFWRGKCNFDNPKIEITNMKN